MSSPGTSRGQSGVAMMEVLIALLLFAISALGLIQLGTATLVRTQETQFRTAANIAATTVGEYAVLHGAVRAADVQDVLAGLAETVPDPEIETETLDNPVSGSVSVAVDVSWRGRDGRVELRHITSLDSPGAGP